MCYRTLEPDNRPWANSSIHPAGKLLQHKLALMVTCFFGMSWPCLAAEEAKEFQLTATEVTENCTAVASNPKLRDSDGRITYDHVRSTDSLTDQPIKIPFRLEMFQQCAFPDDYNRSQFSPSFHEIERCLKQLRDIVRAADRPVDVIRDEPRGADLDVNELSELWIQALAAQATGLPTSGCPAYPGWKVAVVAPQGTIVRYTPYLIYTLNSKPGHTVDWSTAQNGDNLRLRGKYRFELLRGERVIDYREPMILSEEVIRF